MTEIYKTINRLNLSFTIEIFDDKSLPYHLRRMGDLDLPKVRTTCYGTDTVQFMGQRAWAKLPIEIKISNF